MQREPGVIESVKNVTTTVNCDYLAHHSVFRKGKKTSKFSIDFEAYAEENGRRLNYILY